jgi:hypothetical protein
VNIVLHIKFIGGLTQLKLLDLINLNLDSKTNVAFLNLWVWMEIKGLGVEIIKINLWTQDVQ